MLEAKRFFKNIFIKIRLKYFHDSLNIVVILCPVCEFFSAKCVQSNEEVSELLLFTFEIKTIKK